MCNSSRVNLPALLLGHVIKLRSVRFRAAQKTRVSRDEMVASKQKLRPGRDAKLPENNRHGQVSSVYVRVANQPRQFDITLFYSCNHLVTQI